MFPDGKANRCKGATQGVVRRKYVIIANVVMLHYVLLIVFGLTTTLWITLLLNNF